MRKHTRTARQVAFALGLPTAAADFIERQARLGKIPHVSIGGKLFFDPTAVDVAIARLASTGTRSVNIERGEKK